MYLGATGMVCSVGLTAASACAAMRAGIANFNELPYRDNQGEPIIGAFVPDFEPDLRRKERLIELLTPAVKECLGEKPAYSPEKTPLLVGLAEPGRPAGGATWAKDVIEGVQKKLELAFHPNLSRTITTGHTAGFEGLRIARELLKNEEIPACLVCAVDTYCNAPSLLWLEETDRLKRKGNSDGVIPGEAGTALYVVRTPGTESATQLLGLGFGFESANVLSEDPLLGIGLGQAARNALVEANLEMQEIDFRISDVTGETFGFREHSLAIARVMRVVRQEFPIWHCADSIGDTGAAAGLCQLVVAHHAFLKEYAPGHKASCFTSAVPGDRAVAVVQHPTGLNRFT